MKPSDLRVGDIITKGDQWFVIIAASPDRVTAQYTETLFEADLEGWQKQDGYGITVGSMEKKT